jgi:hypothetical protein
MEPNHTIESSVLIVKEAQTFSPLPRLFGSKQKISLAFKENTLEKENNRIQA